MDLLHFGARDIPPYAEPVRASDLEVGHVYFSLTYADDNLCCPTLQPIVFIGRDLEAGDRGRVYFQDASSYLSGHRYGDMSADEPGPVSERPSVPSNIVEFSSGSENETNHVFEFDKALNLLLGCSLRRADRR